MESENETSLCNERDIKCDHQTSLVLLNLAVIAMDRKLLLLIQSIVTDLPASISFSGSVTGPFLLVLIIAVLGYCLFSKKKGKIHEAKPKSSGSTITSFPASLSPAGG